MHLRARKDLLLSSRGSGRDAQWVLKDPVSFTHFLFSREELFLLNLFDGKRTLEQIRKLWQTEYQTKSLTLDQLKGIASRFVRDKLVQVDQFGNGMRLHADEQAATRSRLYMKMASPLVIKLGGVDPRGILDLIWLPGQVLFNRAVVIFNLAVSLLVFLYFVGHFEEIIARAATMAGFFAPKNIVVMMIIIALVKIIHELGHAVACRKYGGECFEIGALLLAFFPTLYCDVTDSWTFRDRWKRIMVAFAGIYIEVMLATICAVLWLLTGQGLANSIFFNMAIMCSINTIFINGNPLLKYDGYYIISDLFEQPNLSQTAQLEFKKFKDRFFYYPDNKTKLNKPLVLFGGLSSLYRVFVIFSIVIGVYILLKGFQFGRIAEGISILLLATSSYRIIKQRSAHSMATKRRVNLPQATATLLSMALLGLAAFFLPLPSSVYCNFGVESEESSIVYASSNGRLYLDAKPYASVVTGQALGTILDLDLGQKQLETSEKLTHLQDRAKRLMRQLNKGSAASDLQVVENEIRKVSAQQELLEEEARNLSLSSKLDGVVRPLPVSNESSIGLEPDSSFFDPSFRNCYVSRGQPLFSIEGNTKRLVAYLGEKEVEFIDIGQQVVVSFNQNVHEKYNAIVEEIIEIDVDLDASATEASGMETYVDQTGAIKTLQTPYRVIISPTSMPKNIRVGSNGRARITVPNTTLVQKIWTIVDRWWNEQNY